MQEGKKGDPSKENGLESFISLIYAAGYVTCFHKPNAVSHLILHLCIYIYAQVYGSNSAADKKIELPSSPDYDHHTCGENKVVHASKMDLTMLQNLYLPLFAKFCGSVPQ